MRFRSAAAVRTKRRRMKAASGRNVAPEKQEETEVCCSRQENLSFSFEGVDGPR